MKKFGIMWPVHERNCKIPLSGLVNMHSLAKLAAGTAAAAVTQVELEEVVGLERVLDGTFCIGAPAMIAPVVKCEQFFSETTNLAASVGTDGKFFIDRVKDPRASLEKLSERLRREKQKYFAGTRTATTEKSAARAWREASASPTASAANLQTGGHIPSDGDDTSDANDTSERDEPYVDIDRRDDLAENNIPVIVTLHADRDGRNPHAAAATARERQIAGDKRRARAARLAGTATRRGVGGVWR